MATKLSVSILRFTRGGSSMMQRLASNGPLGVKVIPITYRRISTRQQHPLKSHFQTRSTSHAAQISEPLEETVPMPEPSRPSNQAPGGREDVLIRMPNGHLKTLPAFWLRDHCPCPDCLHEHTMQRLQNTFEIPLDIQPKEIERRPGGIRVTWDKGSHISTYSWLWLDGHSPGVYSQPKLPERNWSHIDPITPAAFPKTPYQDIINSDEGIKQWTDQIHRYGFAFTPNTPATPTATEELLNRIAHIRHTQYGGFWDFTSVANPTDTAYTNLALPVHTDTTYFTDPCGLQMFHLLSHTEGTGGESTLVDGFAAAAYLYDQGEEGRKYFDVLSRVPIVSHASGNAKIGSVTNTPASHRGFPVLHHDPSAPFSGLSPKTLTQIRWNNDDRHSSTQWRGREELGLWYAAARRWAAILKMPEFEIKVQLTPGEPLIFDNWRMLHGRMAFTGKRRVCGAYISMDDFRARWASLNGD